MKLHTLTSISQKSSKRLGRGHGSGKVKTAGRGQKGQKARGSIKPGFEGGQVSLIHRLPFLRGKGRNASQQIKSVAIPLSRLHMYNDGETVSLETLQKHGLIEKSDKSVKLIGNTPVSQKLTIAVEASKGAQESIKKAGGTVQTQENA